MDTIEDESSDDNYLVNISKYFQHDNNSSIGSTISDIFYNADD